MEIAMVGLGRMGGNMAQRLIKGGHRVVVYDLSEAAIAEMEADGAVGARSLQEVASKLAKPRQVWVMVPSGEVTERTIESLAAVLEPGDTIVDGGNSNYRDSMRHAAMLKERGLNFVDSGTSGGIWGLSEGYCLMIGGEKESVERLRPVFETLAPAADRGWAHVGPAGAGHFVKMVHNGVEYGLMQAYAEGFEIMKAKREFELDLAGIAEVWRHGSVVRSWLLDLTAVGAGRGPRACGHPAVGGGQRRGTVDDRRGGGAGGAGAGDHAVVDDAVREQAGGQLRLSPAGGAAEQVWGARGEEGGGIGAGRWSLGELRKGRRMIHTDFADWRGKGVVSEPGSRGAPGEAHGGIVAGRRSMEVGTRTMRGESSTEGKRISGWRGGGSDSRKARGGREEDGGSGRLRGDPGAAVGFDSVPMAPYDPVVPEAAGHQMSNPMSRGIALLARTAPDGGARVGRRSVSRTEV